MHSRDLVQLEQQKGTISFTTNRTIYQLSFTCGKTANSEKLK